MSAMTKRIITLFIGATFGLLAASLMYAASE